MQNRHQKSGGKRGEGRRSLSHVEDEKNEKKKKGLRAKEKCREQQKK